MLKANAALLVPSSPRPPTFHSVIAPFLADYRAGAWYTRFADLALTFLLAALQVRLMMVRFPSCRP